MNFSFTLRSRSAKPESPDMAFLADRPCSGPFLSRHAAQVRKGRVEVQRNEKKIRCPRCHSGNHYIKEALMKHFCRSCGYLWTVVVDAAFGPLDKIVQVN